MFFTSFIMNQVVIHCKPDYLLKLRETGLTFFETSNNEVDVFVDDIETNSLNEDPDVLLCNHYGIDYDQVNCIELVS